MLPQDASLFHFSSMLSPAGACKAAYDSPDAQGQRAAGDAAAGREGAGRGQPCPGSCHQDPAEVANPDAPYACAGTCLQWGVAMCPLCICLPMSPQFTPVHLHFPVHDGPLDGLQPCLSNCYKSSAEHGRPVQSDPDPAAEHDPYDFLSPHFLDCLHPLQLMKRVVVQGASNTCEAAIASR